MLEAAMPRFSALQIGFSPLSSPWTRCLPPSWHFLLVAPFPLPRAYWPSLLLVAKFHRVGRPSDTPMGDKLDATTRSPGTGLDFATVIDHPTVFIPGSVALNRPLNGVFSEHGP